jgi:hypothetical protein
MTAAPPSRPSRREVALALAGAWRLAFLDRAGLGYFDRSAAGAQRSFWVAVVVVPAYILTMLLSLWDFLPGLSVPRLLAMLGLIAVIPWCAFALGMGHIADALNRRRQYPGWLCAYNWCQVIAAGVMLPATAIQASGLLPAALGDTLIAAVNILLLVIEGFVARAALDIGLPAAIGIVILDLTLTLMVTETGLSVV